MYRVVVFSIVKVLRLMRLWICLFGMVFIMLYEMCFFCLLFWRLVGNVVVWGWVGVVCCVGWWVVLGFFLFVSGWGVFGIFLLLGFMFSCVCCVVLGFVGGVVVSLGVVVVCVWVVCLFVVECRGCCLVSGFLFVCFVSWIWFDILEFFSCVVCFLCWWVCWLWCVLCLERDYVVRFLVVVIVICCKDWLVMRCIEWVLVFLVDG